MGSLGNVSEWERRNDDEDQRTQKDEEEREGKSG